MSSLALVHLLQILWRVREPRRQVSPRPRLLSVDYQHGTLPSLDGKDRAEFRGGAELDSVSAVLAKINLLKVRSTTRASNAATSPPGACPHPDPPSPGPCPELDPALTCRGPRAFCGRPSKRSTRPSSRSGGSSRSSSCSHLSRQRPSASRPPVAAGARRRRRRAPRITTPGPTARSPRAPSGALRRRPSFTARGATAARATSVRVRRYVKYVYLDGTAAAGKASRLTGTTCRGTGRWRRGVGDPRRASRCRRRHRPG